MSNRTIYESFLLRAIERQGHQCAYCTLPFGSVVYVPKHHNNLTSAEVILVAVADHWIPWAIGGDGREDNCVAACEVCNRLKSDNVYDSLQSASRDILIQKMRRGHKTMFIPQTPSTVSYERWQSEYLDWWNNG